MVRACATVKKVFRFAAEYTIRKFPSKYHLSKWPLVERALCIRSIIAMMTILIYKAEKYYDHFVRQKEGENEDDNVW